MSTSAAVRPGRRRPSACPAARPRRRRSRARARRAAWRRRRGRTGRASTCVEAEVVEHLGDLVVDRVHAGEPVTERARAARRPAQGVRVAVDADHPGRGQPLQHRLGVAAEAEGGVDEHGARALERGRQQGDDPVQQDRDVAGAGHGAAPTDPGSRRAGRVQRRGRPRWRPRTPSRRPRRGPGDAPGVPVPAGVMLMVSTPLVLWCVRWCRCVCSGSGGPRAAGIRRTRSLPASRWEVASGTGEGAPDGDGQGAGSRPRPADPLCVLSSVLRGGAVGGVRPRGRPPR